jgi:hypothetical protein
MSKFSLFAHRLRVSSLYRLKAIGFPLGSDKMVPLKLNRPNLSLLMVDHQVTIRVCILELGNFREPQLSGLILEVVERDVKRSYYNIES